MGVSEKTGWTVASAKAHFSEVIEKARAEGPQLVTRNGKPAAVLVGIDEWEQRTGRKGSLREFFRASPLRGAEIELERLSDAPGKSEL